MPEQPKIATNLDDAESFITEFGSAFDSLKSHSSAIISFSHQWETIQKSFVSVKSSHASRADELVKQKKELGLRETELKKREKEVELKRKDLESLVKEIESKRSELENEEKLIEERKNELELKEKVIGERCREIELKEKSISERCREIELKEKSIGERCREIELKEKSIGERCREIELKEKRLNSNVGPAVVVKTEQVSEIGCSDGTEEEDASLRLSVRMDGKALQVFLNDRFDEHDSMGEQVYYALRLSNNPAKLVLDTVEGFYPPRLKKGDVEYEARVVRSSCVLLLEQLMKLKPVVGRVVKEKARVVVGQWREKMKGETERGAVVLGYLLFVAAYGLSALVEKDELERLLGRVDNRMADQLYPILGLESSQILAATSVSQEDNQPQHKSPQVGDTVTTRTMSPKNVLDTLCEQMDANGLSSYLTSHGNEFNLLQIMQALQCAPDPARLVFNVVQGFSRTCSGGNVQEELNKAGCIILLEQLMELSPDISSELRAEALKFATHWQGRLDKEGAETLKLAADWKDKSGKEGTILMDVYGLLTFLGAFKLDSSFDKDELLALFSAFYSANEVYRLEQNIKLCSALSLRDKIPGVIESLIKKKKLLVAVRYICAFDLVGRFRPSPLLKEHVELEVKRCKKRNTVSSQNKLAWREVNALRDVVKCISDHKQLESEISPTSFRRRIRQLKEEIAERNRNSATVVNDKKEEISSPSTKEPKARVTKKRAAAASTMEPQPPEKSQEKRSKLEKQATLDDVSAASICSSKPHPEPQDQATTNNISPASIRSTKPNSQPPYLTARVKNHTSEKSNAVKKTKAPINPHHQMSHPSPPVRIHDLGWSGGAPASGPFPHFYPPPSTYAPRIAVDQWQFVPGGQYPGFGPGHIPPGPVFNYPSLQPGFPDEFPRFYGVPPYGPQHLYHHTF